MEHKIAAFLRDLNTWLEFQVEMGAPGVPEGPGIRALLNRDDPDRAWLDMISRTPDLVSLSDAVRGCTRCPLHAGRNKVVFGQGDPKARLMVVGEAPGRLEDLKGLPFIGRSGDLLTKMLQAIQISRREVFITSVIKCRPPQNRTPSSAEISACSPVLFQQIKIIAPRLILALGQVAAQVILNSRARLRDLRGKIHDVGNLKVIPTYHPAFLLRFRGAAQKAYKREAWKDLQILKRLYDEEPHDTHAE